MLDARPGHGLQVRATSDEGSLSVTVLPGLLKTYALPGLHGAPLHLTPGLSSEEIFCVNTTTKRSRHGARRAWRRFASVTEPSGIVVPA